MGTLLFILAFPFALYFFGLFLGQVLVDSMNRQLAEINAKHAAKEKRNENR